MVQIRKLVEEANMFLRIGEHNKDIHFKLRPLHGEMEFEEVQCVFGIIHNN